MDWETFLIHIQSDGELLARAGEAGLDADAPCCPDWTVGDVVAHTGMVHRQKLRILSDRLTENPEIEEAPVEALLEWYRDGLEQLIEALRTTPPETPVFSWWSPDQTAGFWYRRMAHETLIHRVDAEQALGSVSPIDGPLAADGIDEVLTKYVGGYPTWGSFVPDGTTARIVCTDQSGRWDLRFGGFSGTSPTTGSAYRELPAFEVVESISEPETNIAGTSADLDLWLWGRAPIDRLTVTGHRAPADKLREICADSMQ